MTILNTKQGEIIGKVVTLKSSLTDKKCITFNNIPFATAKRFEHPEEYASWTGQRDGTGETSKVPQYNPMYKEEDRHNFTGISGFNSKLFDNYDSIPGKLSCLDT